MFKEHQRIVLLTDISEENLKAGDVGTIVHIYRDGEAFEVEFLTLDGDTAAIANVIENQIRHVSDKDITHARQMEVRA